MIMSVTTVISEVSEISDMRINLMLRKAVSFDSNPNSATVVTEPQ